MLLSSADGLQKTAVKAGKGPSKVDVAVQGYFGRIVLHLDGVYALIGVIVRFYPSTDPPTGQTPNALFSAGFEGEYLDNGCT